MLSDPRRLSALTLLLILALVGCGEDATAPEPAASPTGSSSAPTTTTPPSDATKKTRLVGEITSIGDCVVLRDDNEVTWTLSGEATEGLAVGDRVQATGTPDLLATGCGGPLIATTTISVTG